VGTGLGLPLVRGVVQSHGGDISVDSKPGEGTTVHLLLPSVEFERRVDADAYQGLPTGTESILLVEDEHLVMLAVEKMLNHLGYTVVTSANAEDALELYRKQSGELDLVITDWSLPGMRGDRLAATMLDVKPSVRVIVYSAYAGDLKNEMLKSDGIRDVLRKPVDIRELAQKVRKALDA
jgi:two-component system, cell cycle sensor histidine kinase and response regulator CckA